MAQQCTCEDYEQNHKQLSEIAVILVPFPMQGHLNEALHLAHLITTYGIPTHYAGTTTHNLQAKLRAHGFDSENSSKIIFHDIQVPSISSKPSKPDDGVTKFPSHLHPLTEISEHLRPLMFRLLQLLASKYRRIVIIHDTLMASVVQDFKSILNAETFALHSVSAFAIFFFIWQSMTEKAFQLDFDIPENIVPSSEGCFTPEFANFIQNEYKFLGFESGRVYNTCRSIEGKYMDLLSKLPVNSNKKLFALGPFNPVRIQNDSFKEKRHSCVDWLDKQEVNSVLFVSFGTATTVSDEQVREVALGLERSDQKFIWVLRRADRVNVFGDDETTMPDLPQGFENRVRNRGIVVRDWAPQLEILAHPSTGGFMSHCGWNSCMESISMGVPIAAWPMHSDQPRNSILVTEELKIGTLVREWADRSKLVTSSTVDSAVVRLMKSNKGDEMRKRATELSDMVRASVAEGGAQRLEMNSFISYITRSSIH